jgi:hypothetical protein
VDAQIASRVFILRRETDIAVAETDELSVCTSRKVLRALK